MVSSCGVLSKLPGRIHSLRAFWAVLFLSILGSSGNLALGAETGLLDFPAAGAWNGFNKHLNIVECSNFGAAPVTLQLTLLRNNGVLIGSRTFPIAPQG